MKEKLRNSLGEFSFAEMTSNSDGKTSGSGTMGVLICSVGSLAFLLGSLDKMFFSGDVDILNQSIAFVSIGALLLGHRKTKSLLEKNTKDSEEKLNS